LFDGVGLEKVGLCDAVSHLSGGQQTKLMLCHMLYRKSDVLLLDEPTNHIEPASVAWLASYLAGLRKTVIVVSHYPAFLDVFVKRIISLEGTPIRAKSYRGNYSSFLQQKSSRELSEQRQQDRLRDEIARQQGFIRSASQHQVGLKHAREKSVTKLKQGLSETKPSREAKIDFPVSVPLSRFALIAKKISFSYGSNKVLDAISVNVDNTCKLAVVGQNGVGKSTLLKLMADELQPQRGTIERNCKLRIGWYRQEQEDLDDRCTILEEAQKIKAEKKRTRGVLAHFLFPAERLNQTVGTLSRGERARLCFAKLVLSGPNLLLLDEPTNHLDRNSRNGLIVALSKYEGAIVVVSHDIDFLKSIGIVWALSMPSSKLERVQ
jgi:ATP-binding cassette subfamily F protein 3